MEYVLIAVLIAVSLFLIVAVLFQRSSDEGLSHTIAGGADTYYSQDKSGRLDKKLRKWTVIAVIVFAVAVLVVYIMQPDYATTEYDLSSWYELSDYSSIFG